MSAWSFCVSLLCKLVAFFLGHCIGLLTLRIWGTLVYLTWKCQSFTSFGLVTGCSAKRLLVLTFVQTVLFLFLLFLCQKELKLGRDVASSAPWSWLWVSLLVVLVGSYVQTSSFRMGMR